MKFAKLKMGIAKAKQNLFHKMGITTITTDEEYERYYKLMEKSKSVIIEKKKYLSSFIENYSQMYQHLINLTQNFISIYTSSDGVTVDYMVPFLEGIIECLEKVGRSFNEKASVIEEEFSKMAFNVQKELAPMKIEAQERDKRKMKFDGAVSQFKRVYAKSRKKGGEQYTEKVDKEKERLLSVLEEYNEKNMYIKEKLIKFFDENPALSDRMIIRVCCDFGETFGTLSKQMFRIRSFLRKITTEKKKRKKHQVHKVTCYILEDEFECSTIIPGKLYCGSSRGADNLELLSEKKIKTIVNCSLGSDVGEIPKNVYLPENITYKEIMLLSENEKMKNSGKNNKPNASETESNFEVFEEFHEIVDRSKTPIFVYCFGGISKSAALIISYFMKKYHMSLLDAFLVCQEKRRFLYPSQHFVRQLQKYERKLRNEKITKAIKPIILPIPRDVVALRMICLQHGERIEHPGDLEAYEEYENESEKKINLEDLDDDREGDLDDDDYDDDDMDEDEDEDEEYPSSAGEEEIIMPFENLMSLGSVDLENKIKDLECQVKKLEKDIQFKKKWIGKEKDLRKMEDELRKKEDNNRGYAPWKKSNGSNPISKLAEQFTNEEKKMGRVSFHVSDDSDQEDEEEGLFELSDDDADDQEDNNQPALPKTRPPPSFYRKKKSNSISKSSFDSSNKSNDNNASTTPASVPKRMNSNSWMKSNSTQPPKRFGSSSSSRTSHFPSKRVEKIHPPSTSKPSSPSTSKPSSLSKSQGSSKNPPPIPTSKNSRAKPPIVKKSAPPIPGKRANAPPPPIPKSRASPGRGGLRGRGRGRGGKMGSGRVGN